jgi:hypothetical protein
MIPLYRKDCLPSDLLAWDEAREKLLMDLLAQGRLWKWAWYNYILKGTLP